MCNSKAQFSITTANSQLRLNLVFQVIIIRGLRFTRPSASPQGAEARCTFPFLSYPFNYEHCNLSSYKSTTINVYIGSLFWYISKTSTQQSITSITRNILK
ncbi:Hypothetical_protein [Hexamita inflata]|uniref:Hypothetical_protein n=1 Tax=Hexamita inflata TaxID=28002 RepID=A0AA86QJJ5_9EUKA|nr:Hypothetical protein HINF_LOCUS45177 [Hexamita inflata]